MTITRVTQNMMTSRSLEHLNAGLSRLSKLQEQVASGRAISRPSDAPAETTTAMRLRATLTEVAQHRRNAEDGQGWLAEADTMLQSMITRTRQAREIGIQAANPGAVSPGGREVLAGEIEQIRDSLIALANTRHQDRPVMGGITGGSEAFSAGGTYAGVAGQVTRTVADGVKVRVDLDAEATLGPDGANLFDHLTEMAAAVRSGDTAALRAGMDTVAGDLDRLGVAVIDVGSRMVALDRAVETADARELSMVKSLAGIEQVDLPKAILELQTQELAYQAALASTSRVMAPSLMDFLR
ncbi:flagellin N-terminal helical domain-containing protein [Nocardioides campestrisoli]|uniref:flagellin N-terminal helical domain-containing protein n=1 Tax=Nocardioides campestrisoli TaxID=2736757 RepID=UPI0015E73B81|nr:flagellar hook protein [Nocardioides campestrisoli]